MYGCDDGHLASCMVVMMFQMCGVSDSTNSFLKLSDVSDVGNDKLIFVCYFIVCSLHLCCVISLAFCHWDMTT